MNSVFVPLNQFRFDFRPTLTIITVLFLFTWCVVSPAAAKNQAQEDMRLNQENRDRTQEAMAAYDAWDKSLETKKVAANLFPSATKVVAYGADQSLEVDPNGKVTFYKVETTDHTPTKISARGGEELSAKDIELLRRSVFYAPPPPAMAACCIPRHGFVFYDSSGKYLGYLKVCYQCGCAIIYPDAPPDPSLSWVVWDHGAIQKILEAHHLKVNYEKKE